MDIITNQVSAKYSSNRSDTNKTVVSNTTNTIVLDEYSYTVTKQSLQQTFEPNENITYAIRVTNNGSKTLNTFVVSDNLGKASGTCLLNYMQYTGRLSINGDFISITPTSTDPLTFNIPYTLSPGQSFTLTYVVTVDSGLTSETTEITNTATVTAKSATEPATSIPEVTDSATIRREISADLEITKSANKSTIYNTDTLEYILTIQNNGLADANNVVITDQLPKGFTLTSVRIENEDYVYDYQPTEYTVDGSNILTLPNDTGTAINIPAYSPDQDHTAVIRLYGTFTNPED